MKQKILTTLLAIFFLAGIVGCGSYYMVKDPTNGQVFYTTKIKDEKGGAIKFTDAKTDNIVTIQNSEVKEISKKEYKSALEPKEAPETK